MNTSAPTKVELLNPLLTPGGEITHITLRRPKVRDLRQAQKISSDPAEQELRLMASLSEEKLTPEDLEELDLGDYAQLQTCFRRMVGDAD